MAKELPYYKFRPTEWLTGDIVFEEMEIQGLFVNICAIYWHRDGDVTLEEIEKRYNNHKEQIAYISQRFLKIKKGKIGISFLDEQFKERGFVSEKNSENGKKGGRPKKQPVTVKPKEANGFEVKPKETNKEVEVEKEQEVIEREKESVAPELQYEYMIGEDEILSIHEIFKEKFPILFRGACHDYGELKVKNWTDDFSKLHKQKTWKDYQDFRGHLSSYFSKRQQNDNDKSKGFNGSKKGLGTTIPTNQGKPAGKL